MNGLWTGLRGLITSLATGVIVLGALSLSLTEGMVLSLPTSQPTSTQISTPVRVTPAEMTSTRAAPTATATTAAPLLVTATPAPPTQCPAPAGWQSYTIQPGDTLRMLAENTGLSVNDLMLANCLLSEQLLPGTFLYLPLIEPSRTQTAEATHTPGSAIVYPSPVPCGPPPGWVRYIVRPGDSLYSLALALNTSVTQLQLANCLGSSTLIRAGSPLWVPFLPPVATNTRTPTPTRTAQPPTITPTGTSVTPPTSTATEEPSPTATVPSLTPTEGTPATEPPPP